jgi:hypothetical protein
MSYHYVICKLCNIMWYHQYLYLTFQLHATTGPNYINWNARSVWKHSLIYNKRMAHFSVVSLTQVVLLLIFICWTSSSTGAAFSLEEEFLQLKGNYVRINLNLFLIWHFCYRSSDSICYFWCLIVMFFHFLPIDSNETRRDKFEIDSDWTAVKSDTTGGATWSKCKYTVVSVIQLHCG